MIKKIASLVLFVVLGSTSSTYSMNYKGAAGLVLTAAVATAGYLYYWRTNQPAIPHYPMPVTTTICCAKTAVMQPMQPLVRHTALLVPKKMPKQYELQKAVELQIESPLAQLPREVLWYIAGFLGADPNQDEKAELSDMRDINNLFITCKALHWKPFYHMPYELSERVVIPLSCQRYPKETDEQLLARLIRRLVLIDIRFQGLPNTEIHLDLSSCKLENSNVLDRFITQVAGMKIMHLITKMDVSYNSISSLCPAIGSFVNLKELNAGSTFIDTLPSEIGRLTNLETLDCSFSNIKILPAELCTLAKLKTLLLGNSNCCALPENIGNLRTLENLELGQCNLTRLPASIKNLTLQKVNVSGNNIPENQVAWLQDNHRAINK